MSASINTSIIHGLNRTAEAIQYCQKTVESPLVAKPMIGLATGISLPFIASLSGRPVSGYQAALCATIGAVWGTTIAFIYDYLPNNTGPNEDQITPANSQTLAETAVLVASKITCMSLEELIFN